MTPTPKRSAKPETPAVLFRVHFLDGDEPVDITARSPDEARKAAEARRPGTAIGKIKRVREG